MSYDVNTIMPTLKSGEMQPELKKECLGAGGAGGTRPAV